MSANRYSSRVILCLLLFIMSPWGISQAQKTDRPADAIANVPELDSFHEVIFKIWHEAWPSKNVAMLQNLLPEVEKGISEVAAAPLPGILREKKSQWEENIKKLQIVGSEYRAAVTNKDDPNLLAAAEKLHSQYATLARLIRPALKEIDEFHSVLYMLYHYYLPEYDSAKIKSSAVELSQKMILLNSAQLPEHLKSMEAEFVTARAKLSKSVELLETAIATNDRKKIENAVSELHNDYVNLNHLFEH